MKKFFSLSACLLIFTAAFSQNPSLIADINPGSTKSSYPDQMVKISDGKYVFIADDEVHGKELWVTDGTPSGTMLVKDMNTGSKDGYILFAKDVIGGKALFSADYLDENNHAQTGLWATDGTTDGTVLLSIADPVFYNNPSNLRTYAEMNGVLYFPAELSSNTQQLWRSDGTAAGTWQVSSFTAGASELNWFAVNNGNIYFRAYENSHGRELWKSNGTTAGTMIVKDLNPGGDSSPEYITAYNGKIYFSAYQGTVTRLWVTDGTAAGTALVLDNESPGITLPSFLYVSGSDLFFDALSPGKGLELWKTDGTHLSLVKDIFPGAEPSMAEDFTGINGTLFFSAYDESGIALWKSDGSETGTVKISQTSGGVEYADFTNVDGDLYYDFYNGSTVELWRTDGSACHTQMLDFFEGGSDETKILLADNTTLFLSLTSSQYGQELWKYNTSTIAYLEICNGFDDDCNGIPDDNPVAIIDPSGTVSECKSVPVTLSTESGNTLSYQWMKNGSDINGATDAIYITSQAGNFQVSVNSLTGCHAASATTHINRIANPEAVITPLGNPDICLAGFVDLKLNDIDGASYEWYRNNALLSGATQSLYHATATGSYKANVTNAAGCSKISKKLKVSSSCKTSVDNAPADFLQVYPNPVSGMLQINQNFTPDGELRIYNMLGQLVMLKSFDSPTMLLDVSQFSRGIYVIQLKNVEGIKQAKFVKE